MKKVSFFVLLASTLFSAAQAQTSTAKKPNWGIKMGLNISNIKVENGTNTDWKTGLATGVYFTIKAANRFSIQPEFLYSSMGGKEITTGNETSLRLNYFSLPVLGKYQISEKFQVVAGPQVDVMIQAKTKGISGFDKVTDEFRENSFYATGGLELWPSHCFGFSARYMYGFNNIATEGAKRTNQGVQLMAALKL